MELIVGGAYQGQLEYAQENHKDIQWLNGETCSLEEMYAGQGIYNFHGFIKRQLEEGMDVSYLAEDLFSKNPAIIIVSVEVGYGVVPMEAFDRAYREAVGRVCTTLAAYSAKVVRVVCGIGTVIKDA